MEKANKDKPFKCSDLVSTPLNNSAQQGASNAGRLLQLLVSPANLDKLCKK